MADFLFNVLAIVGFFSLGFVPICASRFYETVRGRTSADLESPEARDMIIAHNARHLDSLLIHAVEGRLDEADIDEVLKGDLADDFILIAISYGDGRVRQATNSNY